MLEIAEDVLSEIRHVFLSQKVEAGFLLGSTSRLDCLEHCCQIPAKQAGMYFFTPDEMAADKIIRGWAEQGICFCGMIHSHVVPKRTLSEADVEFAEMLIHAFKLPVLWFGIGVVYNGNVDFYFNQVSNHIDGRTVVKQILWKEL